MFRTRLLTVLVGLPIGVWIIWRGGAWVAAVVGLIIVLGLRELVLLLSASQHCEVPMWPTIGGGLLTAIAAYIGGVAQDALLTALILTLFVYLGLRSEHHLAKQAGCILFAWAYWGYLPAHIVLLRNMNSGLEWVMLAVLCTWATDIGAYLIGTRFGRHKLAPRISPNKSVEGAVGGLGASMLVAVVLGVVFALPLRMLLLLGAVISVAGQVGDLLESVLKREANVKDSGKLIPGHGGILDRFDSLVVVVPIVYQIVRLWMG